LHVLSEWMTVEAVSSVEMTWVDNGNSYTKMHFLELFPEKLKNPAETRKCVWMWYFGRCCSQKWLGAIEISSHLGTEKGGVTPSVHHSTSVSHTNRNLWTTRRMLNWLPTVSQETLGVWCIDSLAKRCMPYHNWTHVTVRSRRWTKIIPLYAYDFMDVQDHMPPGAPCDHMILAFYSKLFTF
jgi:hypothetical protein